MRVLPFHLVLAQLGYLKVYELDPVSNYIERGRNNRINLPNNEL